MSDSGVHDQPGHPHDPAAQTPGSGAAKPVTEPPGGELDRELTGESEDQSKDPGVTRGSRDPDDSGPSGG